MRVTHRLYFAALPSMLGAAAVAALAYWGQFARAVPESILLIAALGTLTTMFLSWRNVRYVAERVERLARRSSAFAVENSSEDELDAIEDVVAGLRTVVRLEQVARKDDKAALHLVRKQHARLLAEAAECAINGLNEIRLPLHILLENHFGDLNENQEEMLTAARSAADAIDHDFDALHELARLELGETTFRADRVFPTDLVHAILPSVNATVAARGASIQVEVSPLIPAIIGDRIRLQSALLELVTAQLATVSRGAHVRMSLSLENNATILMLTPVSALPKSGRLLVAQHAISHAGGSVSELDGVFRVQIGAGETDAVAPAQSD